MSVYLMRKSIFEDFVFMIYFDFISLVKTQIYSYWFVKVVKVQLRAKQTAPFSINTIKMRSL